MSVVDPACKNAVDYAVAVLRKALPEAVTPEEFNTFLADHLGSLYEDPAILRHIKKIRRAAYVKAAKTIQQYLVKDSNALSRANISVEDIALVETGLTFDPMTLDDDDLAMIGGFLIHTARVLEESKVAAPIKPSTAKPTAPRKGDHRTPVQRVMAEEAADAPVNDALALGARIEAYRLAASNSTQESIFEARMIWNELGEALAAWTARYGSNPLANREISKFSKTASTSEATTLSTFLGAYDDEGNVIREFRHRPVTLVRHPSSITSADALLLWYDSANVDLDLDTVEEILTAAGYDFEESLTTLLMPQDAQNPLDRDAYTLKDEDYPALWCIGGPDWMHLIPAEHFYYGRVYNSLDHALTGVQAIQERQLRQIDLGEDEDPIDTLRFNALLAQGAALKKFLEEGAKAKTWDEIAGDVNVRDPFVPLEVLGPWVSGQVQVAQEFFATLWVGEGDTFRAAELKAENVTADVLNKYPRKFMPMHDPIGYAVSEKAAGKTGQQFQIECVDQHNLVFKVVDPAGLGKPEDGIATPADYFVIDERADGTEVQTWGAESMKFSLENITQRQDLGPYHFQLDANQEFSYYVRDLGYKDVKNWERANETTLGVGDKAPINLSAPTFRVVKTAGFATDAAGKELKSRAWFELDDRLKAPKDYDPARIRFSRSGFRIDLWAEIPYPVEESDRVLEFVDSLKLNFEKLVENNPSLRETVLAAAKAGTPAVFPADGTVYYWHKIPYEKAAVRAVWSKRLRTFISERTRLLLAYINNDIAAFAPFVVYKSPDAMRKQFGDSWEGTAWAEGHSVLGPHPEGRIWTLGEMYKLLKTRVPKVGGAKGVTVLSPDGIKVSHWIQSKADDRRHEYAETFNRSFQDWLSSKNAQAKREKIVMAYNRAYNGYRAFPYSEEDLCLVRWNTAVGTHCPRYFQSAGARRLHEERGGLLAHDVGVGKTLTAAAAIALGRQEGAIDRPLIVVPNALVLNWRTMLRSYLPDYRIRIIGQKFVKLKKIAKGTPPDILRNQLIAKGKSKAEALAIARKTMPVLPREETDAEMAAKVLAFRDGQFDVAIMPASVLEKIAMRRENVEAHTWISTAIQRYIMAKARVGAVEAYRDLEDMKKWHEQGSTAKGVKKVLKKYNVKTLPEGIKLLEDGLDQERPKFVVDAVNSHVRRLLARKRIKTVPGSAEIKDLRYSQLMGPWFYGFTDKNGKDLTNEALATLREYYSVIPVSSSIQALGYMDGATGQYPSVEFVDGGSNTYPDGEPIKGKYGNTNHLHGKAGGYRFPTINADVGTLTGQASKFEEIPVKTLMPMVRDYINNPANAGVQAQLRSMGFHTPIRVIESQDDVVDYNTRDGSEFTEKAAELLAGRLSMMPKPPLKDEAGKTIFWDDIGIDMMVVDEAHNYKGLFTAMKRGSTAGGVVEYLGGTSPSKTAWQMEYRSALIRRNSGRIVLLTATPAKSSPLDLYNLLHYVPAPGATPAETPFALYGILDPEQYISRYIDIGSGVVVKPSGAVQEMLKAEAFINLEEFRKVFDRFVNRATVAEIPLLSGRAVFESGIDSNLGTFKTDQYFFDVDGFDFTRTTIKEGMRLYVGKGPGSGNYRIKLVAPVVDGEAFDHRLLVEMPFRDDAPDGGATWAVYGKGKVPIAPAPIRVPVHMEEVQSAVYQEYSQALMNRLRGDAGFSSLAGSLPRMARVTLHLGLEQLAISMGGGRNSLDWDAPLTELETDLECIEASGGKAPGIYISMDDAGVDEGEDPLAAEEDAQVEAKDVGEDVDATETVQEDTQAKEKSYTRALMAAYRYDNPETPYSKNIQALSTLKKKGKAYAGTSIDPWSSKPYAIADQVIGGHFDLQEGMYYTRGLLRDDELGENVACGHLVFADNIGFHALFVLVYGELYARVMSCLDMVREEAQAGSPMYMVQARLEEWDLPPQCAIAVLERAYNCVNKPTQDVKDYAARILTSTDAYSEPPDTPHGYNPDYWTEGMLRIGVMNGEVTPKAKERTDVALEFNGEWRPESADDGSMVEVCFVPPVYDLIIVNKIAYEGIDLQKRTCALHHAELPWSPGEFTQKNGRAVRQGAINERIDIFAYLSEGTVDFYRLQRMEGRQAWLDTVMSNRDAATFNLEGSSEEAQKDILIHAVPEDDREEASELIDKAFASVTARRKARKIGLIMSALESAAVSAMLANYISRIHGGDFPEAVRRRQASEAALREAEKSGGMEFYPYFEMVRDAIWNNERMRLCRDNKPPVLPDHVYFDAAGNFQFLTGKVTKYETGFFNYNTWYAVSTDEIERTYLKGADETWTVEPLDPAKHGSLWNLRDLFQSTALVMSESAADYTRPAPAIVGAASRRQNPMGWLSYAGDWWLEANRDKIAQKIVQESTDAAGEVVLSNIPVSTHVDGEERCVILSRHSKGAKTAWNALDLLTPWPTVKKPRRPTIHKSDLVSYLVSELTKLPAAERREMIKACRSRVKKDPSVVWTAVLESVEHEIARVGLKSNPSEIAVMICDAMEERIKVQKPHEMSPEEEEKFRALDQYEIDVKVVPPPATVPEVILPTMDGYFEFYRLLRKTPGVGSGIGVTSTGSVLAAVQSWFAGFELTFDLQHRLVWTKGSERNLMDEQAYTKQEAAWTQEAGSRFSAQGIQAREAAKRRQEQLFGDKIAVWKR